VKPGIRATGKGRRLLPPTRETPEPTAPGPGLVTESGKAVVGMASEVGEVLVASGEIEAKVRELGERITEDYRGEKPLLVGILRGAVVVMSDLMRRIELPCEIDFMEVSSYGMGTASSGVVRILKDLREDITGRHVLIVEDIVDTGLTLSYLRRSLLLRKPASLEICSLLSKPSRRRVELDVRYVGFEVPDEFVVGYGIDYAGSYRNLPDIYAMSPVKGNG
jgi:hypoxanthine phosphoribosyltransferase